VDNIPVYYYLRNFLFVSYFFYIFFVDFIDKSTISHESENGKVPATKRSEEIRVEESSWKKARKQTGLSVSSCCVVQCGVCPSNPFEFVFFSQWIWPTFDLLCERRIEEEEKAPALGLCLMCDCLGIGIGGFAAINSAASTH